MKTVRELPCLPGPHNSSFSQTSQNNKEFALTAVMCIGFLLGEVGDELKEDEDVVFEALRNDDAAILFVPQAFGEKEEFWLRILREKPSIKDRMVRFPITKRMQLAIDGGWDVDQPKMKNLCDAKLWFQ